MRRELKLLLIEMNFLRIEVEQSRGIREEAQAREVVFLGIHEAAHRSPRSMATRSGTPPRPDRARSAMVAVLAAARRQLGPAQVSFGVASRLNRSSIPTALLTREPSSGTFRREPGAAEQPLS